MTAWAHIENIVIVLAVVILIANGHSVWWALLLLCQNNLVSRTRGR